MFSTVRPMLHRRVLADVRPAPVMNHRNVAMTPSANIASDRGLARGSTRPAIISAPATSPTAVAGCGGA